MDKELRKKIISMLVISELVHIVLPVIFSNFVSAHSNEKEIHGHSWRIFAHDVVLNFDGVHYFNNRYEY